MGYRLSELNIEGLTYNGCRLLAHYYRFAFRGDRSQPKLSRSQSVITEWSVTIPEVAPPGYENSRLNRVTAFFPIYDGVGFLIGKRRRETGVNFYNTQEERAIALASAIGAIGAGCSIAQPAEQGHLVYRCVWMPGKALDGDGRLIPSSSNLAFDVLGLSVAELCENNMPLRLFGDARMLGRQAAVNELAFTTTLAERLRPAWQYINSLPGNEQEPPSDTY